MHRAAPVAVGQGAGHVVGVRAHAVARQVRSKSARRASWRVRVPRPRARPRPRPARSRRGPCRRAGWRARGRRCGCSAPSWRRNPTMPSAHDAASVPPARNASASPNLMMRHASPMALFAVAQALTWHMFGPWRPKSMLTMPLAMLEIIIGIMNGETRRGPFVHEDRVLDLQRAQARRCRCRACSRSGSGRAVSRSTPESAIAILAAPNISCV